MEHIWPQIPERFSAFVKWVSDLSTTISTTMRWTLRIQAIPPQWNPQGSPLYSTCSMASHFLFSKALKQVASATGANRQMISMLVVEIHQRISMLVEIHRMISMLVVEIQQMISMLVVEIHQMISMLVVGIHKIQFENTINT